MAAVAVVLFVALVVMPVAASAWPDYHDTDVYVTNPPPRFPSIFSGSPYSYFNMTNASGSLNAIHITNSNTNYKGTCYFKNTLSDTFYVSDTGGRGGQDNIILLVAVNSTNSTDLSNFSIRIKEYGYNWTPVAGGSPPAYASITYWDPSIDVTLGSSDYLNYSDENVQQKWKFAPTANFPIYCGQDMTTSDPNLFKMFLVDNRVGTINGTWYNNTYPTAPALNDNGMTKIEYQILSAPSSSAKIAFNVYAYTDQAAQGAESYNWLNNVNTSAQASSTSYSGWLVRP